MSAHIHLAAKRAFQLSFFAHGMVWERAKKACSTFVLKEIILS